MILTNFPKWVALLYLLIQVLNLPLFTIFAFHYMVVLSPYHTLPRWEYLILFLLLRCWIYLWLECALFLLFLIFYLLCLFLLLQ